MPLIKSASNAARNENIHEMIEAGHPPAQAEAASYANQRAMQHKDHADRNKPRHEHELHKYGRSMPY